jgi:hypothetical protein
MSNCHLAVPVLCVGSEQGGEITVAFKISQLREASKPRSLSEELHVIDHIVECDAARPFPTTFSEASQPVRGPFRA